MSSSKYDEIKRAVHALIEEMKLVSAERFNATPYFDALRELVARLPQEWDSRVQHLYATNDHPAMEDIVEATGKDVVAAPDADREGCYMMIQRLALTIRVMQLLQESKKPRI
jgi:hypothetical protein